MVDVLGAIEEGHPSIVELVVHAAVQDLPDGRWVAQGLELFTGEGTVLGNAGRVGEGGIIGAADPIDCPFGYVCSCEESLALQCAFPDFNGVYVRHRSINKIWK